jgi:vacuolar-type H+-ATPase subunit H
MGSDGPARRREIEDVTAARLAEIVAAAERAAKQVIDQAEEEARTRIADAHEEAEQIVAARLAGLADLTDEINAQAEALRRQAEALQQALARARAEIGGAEALGGSATIGRRRESDREPEFEPEPEPEYEPEPRPAAEPEAAKPAGPSLTVVGGIHEEPALENGRAREASSAADRRLRDTAPVEPSAPAPPSAPPQDLPEEISLGNGSPAGARLLATQMAVSGSSRAEIEARLRNGFKIADTGAILDAILGPESPDS